ncbi:MAG TPA: lysyl oxidase family protein [Kofleriaceae bacterium]|nr:lysyl oxidase family protein [Kofleriaceae bacterium]
MLLVSVVLAGCQSSDGVVPDPPLIDGAPPSGGVGDLPGQSPVTEVPPVEPAQPDASPSPPPDAAPQPPPDAAIPLPDLAVMTSQMAATVVISEEGFSTDDCALSECLTQPGLRKLLRFATGAANLGTADLLLGDPDPDLPEWEYDSCHMHYHYLNFADYALVSADDTVVALGHKQSFCLRDDQQVIAGAPSQGYDCNYQGLSVGWADIYGASLDCQWVDITGVPPGDYLLRVELNPLRVIPESSYDNNLALIPVTIP